MSTTKRSDLGAKRYWREDDARRALADLARSGLSLRRYCLDAGISQKKLQRWKAKLATSTPQAGFREVHVANSPPARARTEAGLAGEVVVGSYRVRAPLGFDAAELRRLIETVSVC